MDWNIVIAAATTLTVILGCIKYRYDRNKDMPYINATIEHPRGNKYHPDWTLIKLTFYPTDKEIYYHNIRGKGRLISLARDAYGTSTKDGVTYHGNIPEMVQPHGVSSLDISLLMRPSFVDSKEQSLLVFVESSHTLARKAVVISFKSRDRLISMKTTPALDANMDTNRSA